MNRSKSRAEQLTRDQMEQMLPTALRGKYEQGYRAGLLRAAEIARDEGSKFQFGTTGRDVRWYVGVADASGAINNALSRAIKEEADQV